MDKEKLLKKTKMIFLLEYIAIAVILILVGFLRLFEVIKFSEQRLLVYNILTLIGFAYITFDLIWYIASKKKRERSDLIDKLLPIPLAIFLLVFDILVLAKIITDPSIIKYCISAVLLYAGAYSLSMGIYHHFKPSKMLLLAVEEEYQGKQKELLESEAKENSESNNIEE